jgi:serine phosphatase RsbU (regulator of sigma subunit)
LDSLQQKGLRVLNSQKRSPAKELGLLLTEALAQADGLNDLLDRFLNSIGSVLGAPRLALYDYDDPADHFDILYWRGYPQGSRSELRTKLFRLNIRRALSQREPFRSDESAAQVLVPLYFRDPLEAVLLLEFDDHPFELDEARMEACRLISRFLGLFLSSNRLPVNQKQDVLAKTDLERAREVQMSYLPSEHPVTDRYETYAYNQSSSLVGGDYFDYFCKQDNSIQCVVADAVGHGLSAALIMSTFRGVLHSEVRRNPEFCELVNRLNRHLYNTGQVLQYLTVVFFEYDVKRGELRHFNAGHFDPVIIHQDGSNSRLSGGGPPLGMFQNTSYTPQSSRMDAGDLLLLFTDGLVELRNARDELFGIERILEAVVERRNQPLKDLASGVLEQAAGFSHKSQPDDDLTLFLMRFR